jgi:tRNA-splicing ligase RtcB
MNTHAFLLENGYASDDPAFSRIAKLAHNLINNKGVAPDDALEVIRQELGEPDEKLTFRENPSPIKVYGEVGPDIEEYAYKQLEKACRLPVAVAGSLLPDAHPGYALPVGGVAALENAVSPAFVGFDIACRMKMSILDIPVNDFEKDREKLAATLNAVTSFGLGADFADGKRDHPVMEDPRWSEIPRARQLKDKAARQLGSSGSGNHFADLMTGTITKEKEWLPLKKGDRFVALVTHSGSRGTGHQLATYYKDLAERHTQRISKGISKNYAWLSLDSEGGQEYWQAMQLMGDYASANHALIHHHFTQNSGIELVASYENHHNFAWEKEVDGTRWIIHRKGATPAEDGVAGIIPGSMGTPSYLVEGIAGRESLWSSSHGAGRISSRTKAKKNHDAEAYRKLVRKKDILTIGVAKDETYQCYKDINHIIDLQKDKLIDVVAKMEPRVVVMGGGRRSDDGD